VRVSVLYLLCHCQTESPEKLQRGGQFIFEDHQIVVGRNFFLGGFSAAVYFFGGSLFRRLCVSCQKYAKTTAIKKVRKLDGSRSCRFIVRRDFSLL